MEQIAFDFSTPARTLAAQNVVATLADISAHIDENVPLAPCPLPAPILAMASAVTPAAPDTPPLPASPAWQSELPSFAEALTFLDVCQDISATKRRDLRSALISAAKHLGQAPRDIKLDLKALSQTSLAKVPKLREIKIKRRRNILAGINKVAALMGVAEPHRPGPEDRTPAWQALHERLANKYEAYILARLSQYCSLRGVSPDAVDTNLFACFSEHLAANAIKSELGNHFARIASLWNKLVDRYPDLQLRPIERPGIKPGLTIKLELFTPAFRADLAQFKAALSAADLGALYDDLDLPPETCPYRPSQPLKPSTVRLRVDQIKYAASALVHSGLALEEINGLADLLTPIERVKTVIRHLRERGASKRSSYVEGVIAALCHAARYCQADPQTHHDLATLKKTVHVKYDGMVSKNRDRLRAITEPGTKAIILSLPQLLLEDARKLDEPLEAARLVRIAIAIELLTVAAPRIDNLNKLRIDQSLRRAANGKRQITHMVVDATDVKNGVAIERHLPPESAELLEQWLSHYRPLLAKAGSPWLFPGAGDNPLDRSAFRKWITQAIRDYANVEVHPHLFRHFCAWIYLQHYPGDFEGVRRLLGHKRIETSIKSYIAFEQEITAERHDKVVLKERSVAKRLIRQLAKPARSSARKPVKTKGAHHAKTH